jgi:hypothetical protein
MELENAIPAETTEQTGLGTGNIRSLFQPDTLLFTQFFDDRRSKAGREPEKRLMLAVLEDAIHCFQENHAVRRGKKKRLFDNVQSWLFEASRGWVFGFENICSVLEVNPEYVRKGLIQWQEKESLKPLSAPLWIEPKPSPGLKFSAPTSGEPVMHRTFSAVALKS